MRPCVRPAPRLPCRQPQRLGRDIGVDPRRCSVTESEEVVLVVQLGEPLGERQIVPEAPVDSEGQLPWRQLAGRHPGGKRSYDRLLAGIAAHCGEGEAQFTECRGQEAGDVVIRLRAGARSQDPQRGAVQTGDECVTGSGDDVGGADLTHTPQNGTVLKPAGGWSGRRHVTMIPSAG
ncbi:hypothetical protein ACFY9A_05545 [Streptomyces rubradiris]|uniref:hypothetical protein n=1 Tax=Streptomyces rubradiris TaxID=285531 RepID=UPI0036E987F7